MPRFSLKQLLMGTALFGVLLVFTQTEGCGTRYSTIETLSFSSDGLQIVVTKLTARDSRTPMKAYKSNLARTVSLVDTATGRSLGVIHQDFKPGNSGPAFGYWWPGRTSVICNPNDDRIAISGFGGGDLTFGVEQSPETVSLPRPASNLTISKSGRFLAASGANHLTVVDTSTLKTTMKKQIADSPFLGASLMSFNSDDSLLISVGYDGAQVWDLAAAAQTATLPIDPESWVRSIAVMPDDSVVICSDSWTKRFDLSGALLNTIDGKGGYVSAASRTSNTLAISDGETVRLCDVTDGTTTRTLSASGVMSFAVSSDDKFLATGDNDGNVELYDLSTGTRKWVSSPPGRHRWPWTIPATILGVWCWIAYRLFNQRGKPST